MKNAVLSLLLLSAVSLAAVEEGPKVEVTEKTIDLNALAVFADPAAGYSFKVPPGYQKLTAEQNREVFDGLSKYLGKEVSERAERQPPAWFNGPADPKRPQTPPPSLGIGFSDLDEPIDPSRMDDYKRELEQEYKRKGDRFGDIKLEVVKVDGINSLRVEHDIFSPVDNSRSRMIKVAVPGHGRRYDIVFTFSTGQAKSVEEALSVVLNTFKVDKHPEISSEAQSKWSRVMLWTAGGFAAGILLSLILMLLSRVGSKPAVEESGG